jgi:hypothetical protein
VKNRYHKMLFFMLPAILMVSLTDCAGFLQQQYGRMDPSQEAARQFESARTNPNYAYYSTGSDTIPSAILGLDKKRTLATTLWKSLDSSSEKLSSLVSGMQTKALQMGQTVHGFTILDEQGKPIGVWYSLLSARQPVVIHRDGAVDIYTPNADIYDAGTSFKSKLR